LFPHISLYRFPMKKIENVPGVFSQYTYTDLRTSAVLGVRYDYNSLYKQSMFTPRLHMRREVSMNGVLRGSVGRSFRSPIALAENLGFLASSRVLNIPTRLGLEDAWNYGINYVHTIPFSDEQHVITLSFDAYRTDFRNQLIVDLDRSAQAVDFYMSKEKAFANSFQVEARANMFDNLWSLTLAGRYNESKQTTNGKLQDKIFVPRWKFLMVNNFVLDNKWMLDITSQYNGKVRLPNTNGAFGDYSKAYPFFITQLTRRFEKLNFDVYVGCENVLNHVQKDPIIGWQDPVNNPAFDATVIYAPLMGRMLYIGLRWTPSKR